MTTTATPQQALELLADWVELQQTRLKEPITTTQENYRYWEEVGQNVGLEEQMEALDPATLRQMAQALAEARAALRDYDAADADCGRLRLPEYHAADARRCEATVRLTDALRALPWAREQPLLPLHSALG